MRDMSHKELRACIPKDALIYSEKPCLPKAKTSKIKALDSRLRGNDDFFSVFLTTIKANTSQSSSRCRIAYLNIEQGKARQ
jgi:hypothetical protein